jgi:hypothetical protein
MTKAEIYKMIGQDVLSRVKWLIMLGITQVQRGFSMLKFYNALKSG